MSDDWKSTLVDRLTSIPFLIFLIIVLAAVVKVLDPDILHSISGDLKGLFQ